MSWFRVQGVCDSDGRAAEPIVLEAKDEAEVVGIAKLRGIRPTGVRKVQAPPRAIHAKPADSTKPQATSDDQGPSDGWDAAEHPRDKVISLITVQGGAKWFAATVVLGVVLFAAHYLIRIDLSKANAGFGWSIEKVQARFDGSKGWRWMSAPNEFTGEFMWWGDRPFEGDLSLLIGGPPTDINHVAVFMIVTSDDAPFEQRYARGIHIVSEVSGWEASSIAEELARWVAEDTLLFERRERWRGEDCLYATNLFDGNYVGLIIGVHRVSEPTDAP